MANGANGIALSELVAVSFVWVFVNLDANSE